MSLDNLHRRIDKLIEAIEQQQRGHVRTEQGLSLSYTMHLFTEREQAALQAFLDMMSVKKCSQSDTDRLDLSELSNQELDRFLLWLELEKALLLEDTFSAAKCRRWLNMSLEQLVQAFLSIDLSFLPTDVNEPGIPIQEGHCIYSLSRTWHRYIAAEVKLHKAERYMDDMRRWLNYIDENKLAAA